MLKGKKKTQYQRDYMKKKRGLTKEEGGLTHPDIIDKLTDDFWRPRLERICLSFKGSPYKDDVYLGVPDKMFTIGGSGHRAYSITGVCDLVEATR